MNFLLIDYTPVTGKPEPLVPHYWQQTDYSCGAACLSMVLGISETECRRLAKTTRTGTHMHNMEAALRALGRTPHHVHVSGEFGDHFAALLAQSMRWPLVLDIEFKHEGRDAMNRRRRFSRHHAVVLSGGRFLDPAHDHELDAEAVGHLHERGMRLKSYIIVES